MPCRMTKLSFFYSQDRVNPMFFNLSSADTHVYINPAIWYMFTAVYMKICPLSLQSKFGLFSLFVEIIAVSSTIGPSDPGCFA